MNSETTDLPVLVAGGGIGGLAAALALVRQGFKVTVLEQAPEIGEIGAGIQLGPNAFHAFDALGIGDKARGRAVYTDYMVMHDALDEYQVGKIPTGEAFLKRFGNPYAVIHRQDIHVEAVQNFLLHRGDRRKGLLAEDGVRCQDARFAVPEAIQGNLATRLADLIDAHHARDEQRDGVDMVTLHEHVMALRDVRHEGGLSEVAQQGRLGSGEDRQGLEDAFELLCVDHLVPSPLPQSIIP